MRAEERSRPEGRSPRVTAVRSARAARREAAALDRGVGVGAESSFSASLSASEEKKRENKKIVDMLW